MLDGLTELLAIANIALALAGFAAILVVLAGRGTRVHASTAALIQSLASIALGAGMLCLAPITMVRLGVAEHVAWGHAATVGAVTGFVLGGPAFVIGAFRVLSSEALDQLPADVPVVDPIALRVLVSLPFTPWLMLVSLSVGWPFAANVGTFLLCVVSMLGIVALQFFWALMTMLNVD